jgi:hypothetical protein
MSWKITRSLSGEITVKIYSSLEKTFKYQIGSPDSKLKVLSELENLSDYIPDWDTLITSINEY